MTCSDDSSIDVGAKSELGHNANEGLSPVEPRSQKLSKAEVFCRHNVSHRKIPTALSGNSMIDKELETVREDPSDGIDDDKHVLLKKS